jgi:hypothetical protein
LSSPQAHFDRQVHYNLRSYNMHLSCSVTLRAALLQTNEASRNTEVIIIHFYVAKLGMEMVIEAISLVLEHFFVTKVATAPNSEM